MSRSLRMNYSIRHVGFLGFFLLALLSVFHVHLNYYNITTTFVYNTRMRQFVQSQLRQLPYFPASTTTTTTTDTTTTSSSDEPPVKLQSKTLRTIRTVTTMPSHCSDVPTSLVGQLLITRSQINSTSNDTELFEEYVEKRNQDLHLGGWWSPRTCAALRRTAFVIPYRNRATHLMTLLDILLPVLKRQQIHFRIFLVEQANNGSFNKGRLMNTGFKFINDHYPIFDCIVFHDVDLVPEDDRNMYTCGYWPKHMSPAVDTLNYKLPYEELVGGVLAITNEHFRKANGFSNMYWGWGGEDDDFYKRLTAEKLYVDRPPLPIGRYTMLKHEQRTLEPNNLQLLNSVNTRYKLDGLDQLNSTCCPILSVDLRKLYTHILVDVDDMPADLVNSTSEATESPVESHSFINSRIKFVNAL